MNQRRGRYARRKITKNRIPISWRFFGSVILSSARFGLCAFRLLNNFNWKNKKNRKVKRPSDFTFTNPNELNQYDFVYSNVNALFPRASLFSKLFYNETRNYFKTNRNGMEPGAINPSGSITCILRSHEQKVNT